LVQFILIKTNNSNPLKWVPTQHWSKTKFFFFGILVKGIYTQTLIVGSLSNNINHPMLKYNILMMNLFFKYLKTHQSERGKGRTKQKGPKSKK
jgi:hypothetical protein